VGINGNERADRLAGSATIAEGQHMDHVDIVNAFK
jgi:hypothetical protein